MGAGPRGGRGEAFLDALFAYRLPQQLLVLLYKNVLVAWRSRRATAIRLAAPMLFLLLALVMQAALDASLAKEGRYRPLHNAVKISVAAIPDCGSDLYIHGKPCATLVYSPSTSAAARAIIERVRANNGAPMPRERVLGFATRAEAEAFLAAHGDTTLGAVHFVEGGRGTLEFVLQASSAPKQFKSYVQDPQLFWQLPVQSAVSRELARQALLDAGRDADAAALEWAPSMARFPHPEMTTLSLTGRVIAPCVFAACMFGAVTQMAQIVAEKDGGLRQAMRTMGLMESSYWGSWVVFDLAFGAVLSLVIVLSGMALRFRFFLANDFSLLFLLFWLFLAAISGFVYFATAFVAKPQAAVYVGFIVFLAGWTFQGIVTYGLPYTPSFYFESDLAKRPYHRAIFWLFTALPWNPLAKAILDMAAATNTPAHPGLRWRARYSYCVAGAAPAGADALSDWVDDACIYPVGQCLATLAAHFAIYTLLAVWLDNVLPNGLGVSRHPLFFLRRAFWRPRAAEQGEALARLLAEGEARLAAEKLAAKRAAARAARLGGDGAAERLPRPSAAGGPDEDEDVGREAGRLRRSLTAKLGGPARVEGSEWLGFGRQQQQQQGGRVGSGGSGAGLRGGGSSQSGMRRRSGAGGSNSGAAASSAALAVQAQAHAAARAWHWQSGGSSAGGAKQHGGGSDHHHHHHYSQQQQHHGHSHSHSHHHHFDHEHHRDYAVEVFGLRKVFPVGWWTRTMPRWLGGKPNARDFWAIKDSWFGIEQGSLFCLLGPNGAGKTTTINVLTGALPPTAGDALVYGESLCGEGGLDRVRSLMGVCPQFDVLWGELTGAEHLTIYGHVKGLKFSEVRRGGIELLARVKLERHANVRSSAYSGGMKRRLSVAIALLGDPKVVYLDEPTTGMDPISRRYVWDIIQEAKAGRAIVLTTHSMEEADILADRIAIMARGRLKAIGSSLRLKQKYGAGYTLSASVLRPQSGDNSADALAARADAAREFFLSRLGLLPFDEGRTHLHYLVPRASEDRLAAALAELEGASGAAAAGVTDVQVSMTSLEEVFLTIARRAELAAAEAQGATAVEVPLPDGGRLSVALGQDRAAAPDGREYAVKWAQDDAGRLVVLDVSPIGGGGGGSGVVGGVVGAAHTGVVIRGSSGGGGVLRRRAGGRGPRNGGGGGIGWSVGAGNAGGGGLGAGGRRDASLGRLLASGLGMLLGTSAAAHNTAGGATTAGGNGSSASFDSGSSSGGGSSSTSGGGGGGSARGRVSSGGGAAAAELGERGYRLSASSGGGGGGAPSLLLSRQR